MKNKASRKRRLFLTKNFILMLVLLVEIILASHSWFTTSTSATASGISIQSRSGNEINIAKAVKTYNDPSKGYYDSSKEKFAVLSDGPGVFEESVSFEGDFKLTKDCTGDGITMIIPDFNVTKDYESVRKHYGKEVNLNSPAATARSNEYSRIEHLKNPNEEAPEYQYLEFEFYVRSMNKDLFLDPSSVLLSITEKSGGSLSDTPSAEKKSAYGNFNVDALVGAMRVSIIGEGCTTVTQNFNDAQLVTEPVQETQLSAPTATRLGAQKQLLWVARPDIYLEIPQQERNITDWTVSTGVLPNTPTGAITYKHSYYKPKTGEGVGVELVDNDETAIKSSGTGSGGYKTLGQSINISDFTYSNSLNTISLFVDPTSGSEETANYYVTKYTLRIWIEGTDSEARRAMDGGQFDLKLRFT